MGHWQLTMSKSLSKEATKTFLSSPACPYFFLLPEDLFFPPLATSSILVYNMKTLLRTSFSFSKALVILAFICVHWEMNPPPCLPCQLHGGNIPVVPGVIQFFQHHFMEEFPPGEQVCQREIPGGAQKLLNCGWANLVLLPPDIVTMWPYKLGNSLKTILFYKTLDKTPKTFIRFHQCKSIGQQSLPVVYISKPDLQEVIAHIVTEHIARQSINQISPIYKH